MMSLRTSQRPTAKEGNERRQIRDSVDRRNALVVNTFNNDLNGLPLVDAERVHDRREYRRENKEEEDEEEQKREIVLPLADNVTVPELFGLADEAAREKILAAAKETDDDAVRALRFKQDDGERDVRLEQRLIHMDVEFHTLNQGPISQLCAISLDQRKFVFNRYVSYKPLHPDWRALIDRGQVEESPWDSPQRARPWDEVFFEFLQAVPKDSILLWKGTSDISRMWKTLDEMQPPPAARQVRRIRRRCAERNLQHLQIDQVWKALCVSLPPDIMTKVMTARGSMARSLHSVFDDLLWRPLLVKVDPSLIVQESIVATKLGNELAMWGTLADSVHDNRTKEAVMAEFLSTKHLEPVWHTAHTDTIMTLNITLFLLYCVEHRVRICEFVLRNERLPRNAKQLADVGAHAVEDMGFYLFATVVANQTKLFRFANLRPTAHGAAYLDRICRAGNLKLVGAGRDPPDAVPAAIPPPAPAPAPRAPAAPVAAAGGNVVLLRAAAAAAANPNKNNAPSIRKARERRIEPPGILLQEADDSWLKVYNPRLRGADAFKVRALKTLLEVDEQEESIYTAIEEVRKAMHPSEKRAIGDRPWYFYPNATGAKGPGIQVMHTRHCTDRKNGGEFGQEHPVSKGNVAFYDFARVAKVPVFTLRFCKVCKQYAETAKPNSSVSNRTSETDGSLATVLALLVLACHTTHR